MFFATPAAALWLWRFLIVEFVMKITMAESDPDIETLNTTFWYKARFQICHFMIMETVTWKNGHVIWKLITWFADGSTKMSVRLLGPFPWKKRKYWISSTLNRWHLFCFLFCFVFYLKLVSFWLCVPDNINSALALVLLWAFKVIARETLLQIIADVLSLTAKYGPITTWNDDYSKRMWLDIDFVK